MTRSMSFARSAFTQSSTRCRMRLSATISSFSPRDMGASAEWSLQLLTSLVEIFHNNDPRHSRGVTGCGARLSLTLAVKHCQIELAEPLRIAKDVDLGDLPVADRERQDRERLSFEHGDQPRDAVDQDRAPENPESREGQRSTRHVLRTAELGRSSGQLRTGVSSEDDIRVEDSDKPVEVTVARSHDKGVHNASLNVHMGLGRGIARLNAAAGAAG